MMAVVLFSVQPLPRQRLLHLYLTHMTNLLTDLPPSHPPQPPTLPQLVIIIFRSEHLHHGAYQMGRDGRAPSASFHGNQ